MGRASSALGEMSDANTSDLLVQVEQLTRRAEASEAALRAERARSEQEVRDLAVRNEQLLREQAARNEQVLQEQASRLRQATEEKEASLRKEFQALKTENEALRRVPAALKALESDVGGLRDGYSQLWRQQRQPPESEEQVRQRREALLQAEKEFALSGTGSSANVAYAKLLRERERQGLDPVPGPLSFR